MSSFGTGFVLGARCRRGLDPRIGAEPNPDDAGAGADAVDAGAVGTAVNGFTLERTCGTDDVSFAGAASLEFPRGLVDFDTADTG
mmetsp:Transcript_23773/g.35259  ORF Transcript_23773/g.35259 Transcript_23773/m.35259 type:complete len:85 (+) Transcript_23773:638-892(+)